MIHAVRGLLLLAVGGLIARLLLSGQMALYMSPALNPLTGGAGVVLVGMGIFELYSAGLSRGADGGAAHASVLEEALTSVLVLVPVGLGVLTVPHALDSTALGGQDVTRVVVAFSPTPAEGSVGPPPQPIEDVTSLFSYLRSAGESGVGQRVHLVGVVARGGSLTDDEFVLLRYTIVHCVADAQPIGLLVRMPHGPPESTTNAWVEIDGTLAATEQGGAHLVSVLATRVAPTDEPAEPYLRTL